MWSMVVGIRLSKVALTVLALMVAHLITVPVSLFLLFMRYIHTLSQYFSKYNYLGFLSLPSGYENFVPLQVPKLDTLNNFILYFRVIH